MTYTKTQNPNFILCIDWETTGTNWKTLEDTFANYQGISFGAIVVDAITLEPVEDLYREIKFNSDKYQWSKEAEAIHGLSIEYLEANGLSSEDACIDLASLILKYFGTGKVMFMGHNTEFDIKATEQLFNDNGLEIQVHHIKLDSSSLAHALINEYRSDIVFEVLGGIDKRECHNALGDAYACLTSIRNARQIFEAGLASLGE